MELTFLSSPHWHRDLYVFELLEIIGENRYKRKMHNFLFGIVLADGLAPLDARTSAGTVMIKFALGMYKDQGTVSWQSHF